MFSTFIKQFSLAHVCEHVNNKRGFGRTTSFELRKKICPHMSRHELKRILCRSFYGIPFRFHKSEHLHHNKECYFFLEDDLALDNLQFYNSLQNVLSHLRLP